MADAELQWLSSLASVVLATIEAGEASEATDEQGKRVVEASESDIFVKLMLARRAQSAAAACLCDAGTGDTTT